MEIVPSPTTRASAANSNPSETPCPVHHNGICRARHSRSQAPLPCPGKGGARVRADRAAAIHAPAAAAGVCMGPREPPAPRSRSATSQALPDNPSPHVPSALPLLLRLQGQWPDQHSRLHQEHATAGARCPWMPNHHVLPRPGEGRDVLPGEGWHGGAWPRVVPDQNDRSSFLIWPACPIRHNHPCHV